MGVVIMPLVISDNMRKANAQLDNLRAAVEQGNTALNSLVDTRDLEGVAWGNTRNYFQEIQIPILQTYRYWIEAQKEANNGYSLAAGALPQVAVLCEDTLIKEMNSWKIERMKFENIQNTIPLMRLSNQFQIERCDTLIRALDNKLGQIQRFQYATNSIYDAASRLKDILANVDANLGKVTYNSTTKSYDYSGVDTSWINSMAREYLLHQDITELQISNMEAKGYSLVELRNIVVTLNPTDIEFFKCLMTGTEASYIEAFKINPMGLSEPTMSMVLAQYSARLIVLDESGNCTNLEDLEMFNNAILVSTESIVDIHGKITNILYRDKYLEKLYVGSDALLTIKGSSLSFIEKDSPGYDKEYDQYLKLLGITNFWYVENILANKYDMQMKDDIANEYYRTPDIFKQYALNVSDLTYTKGGFRFTFMHEGASDGKVVQFEEELILDPLLTGRQLEGVKNSETMRALAAAREGYLGSLIGKGLGTLGMIGFSGAPAAAGITLELLVAFIDGATKFDDLTKEDEAFQKNKFSDMFASGGSYSIIGSKKINLGIESISNPDALRGMRKIKEQGISGIGFNLDEGKLINAVKKDPILKDDIKLQEKCITLVSGGYDILKEKNFRELNEMITHINRIGSNELDETIDLTNTWGTYMEQEGKAEVENE